MSSRTLVTISISHYCEKARWALDRAGIAYVERRHLPGMHRFVVRRAGGGVTVPMLVCEDGVLPDSPRIVAWADGHLPVQRRLIPDDPAVAQEAQALAADFDDRLGRHSRRWIYFNLHGRRDLAAPLTDGVPAWQRDTFRLTYAPIAFIIDKHFNITPESAARSERITREVFDEVGERLADGRRHLTGDRFSTADLTFAALAAPLVMPPEYGVALPPVEALPEPMAATIRELRAHPAGEHALRMFREERVAPS
jgi:glutathione S-transferase